MMKNQWKRIYTYIVLLMTIFLIVLSYWKSVVNRKKSIQSILDNPIIVNGGNFTQFKTGKGKTYSGIYRFEIENIAYFGEVSVENSFSRMNNVFNISFPVIFRKDDPTLNVILLTESDFNDYNLSIPDSLRKKY